MTLKAEDLQRVVDEEGTGDKAKYQAFFRKALKKFGVKSPSELSDDKKTEFFTYVDNNWKSDAEEGFVDEATRKISPVAMKAKKLIDGATVEDLSSMLSMIYDELLYTYDFQQAAESVGKAMRSLE